MEKEFLLLIGMVFVSLPGAINTVGSALEKIFKAKQALAAPNEEQNKRLDDLERRMTAAEGKLNNDHQEITEIHESNRISALALIALLDHSLDGNNVDQMKTAKDELNHWLAKK